MRSTLPKISQQYPISPAIQMIAEHALPLNATQQSSRGKAFPLLAARPVRRLSGIFPLHGAAHKNIDLSTASFIVTDNRDDENAEQINDEDCKIYGTVKPSLSRNQFTDAVLAKADYEDTNLITHTYAANFDGNGKEEAFVIAGEWGTEWGDDTLEMIYGELWFIDSSGAATRLVSTTTFQSWQQYIMQDGKIYFFIDYNIAFTSWGTLVLTVKGNQLMIFPCYGDKIVLDPANTEHLYLSNYAWGTKLIQDDGQIIVTHNCYDGMLEILKSESEDGDRFLWFGHTWKPYTFEFDHEQWKETPARGVTREEVESIAALPQTFDSSAYDGVQYILRDNGELNINLAKTDHEYPESVSFENLTFLLSESREWIAQERDNNGIYAIQLTGESHWDYPDNLLAELQ